MTPNDQRVVFGGKFRAEITELFDKGELVRVDITRITDIFAREELKLEKAPIPIIDQLDKLYRRDHLNVVYRYNRNPV